MTKGLFYIADAGAAGSSAPLLENDRMESLKVFYMVDPVVEFAVLWLKEVDGKVLMSTSTWMRPLRCWARSSLVLLGLCIGVDVVGV